MSVDLNSWKNINDQMLDVLRVIAEHNGLSVKINGYTYDKNNCTYKVCFAKIGEDGKPKDPAREAFKTFCGNYGLTKEMLDKMFVVRGEHYKIIGLKTRNHKYPVIAEKVSNGRKYKFHPKTILQAKAGTY